MADVSSLERDESSIYEKGLQEFPLNSECAELPQDAAALLHEGNRCLQRKQYDESIKIYREAINLKTFDPSVFLANRCAAYCRFSIHLRNVPASSSERSPLFGPDPMSLAELAVKDADKLLQLHNDWPKAYFLKGTSHVLLEQYEDARKSYLSGLQLDPTNSALQLAVNELSADDQPIKNNKQEKGQYSDEFDCTLCFKLLYNPVTTPCGHSFCRSCLMQAMDHNNRCPMCRTILFLSSKTYPLSVTLNNVIRKTFPKEYAERKAEMDETVLSTNEILPLFVMSFVLPYQKMGLNIFEPRYRLMVRRIMEGNRRMGMVGLDPETHSVANIACEVEICEFEPLADGRFLLQVEGRRRCHITKSWEQDGYRVGQVKFFEDTPIPEGSAKKQKVTAVANEALEIARNWMSWLQRDHSGKFGDLLTRAEGMPSVDEHEHFSFWVVGLLSRCLPVYDKLELLRIADTEERLRVCIQILRANLPC